MIKRSEILSTEYVFNEKCVNDRAFACFKPSTFVVDKKIIAEATFKGV